MAQTRKSDGRGDAADDGRMLSPRRTSIILGVFAAGVLLLVLGGTLVFGPGRGDRRGDAEPPGQTEQGDDPRMK